MVEIPSGTPNQPDGTTLLTDNDSPIVFNISEVDTDTELLIGDKITGIKSVDQYGKLIDLLADQLALAEDPAKQYNYSEFRGNGFWLYAPPEGEESLGSAVRERISQIAYKLHYRGDFKDFEVTLLSPLTKGSKIRSHTVLQGIRLATTAKLSSSRTGDIKMDSRLGISLSKPHFQGQPHLIKSVLHIDEASNDFFQRIVEESRGNHSQEIINRSRNNALQVERRALLHPFQGGLPSLGKRS